MAINAGHIFLIYFNPLHKNKVRVYKARCVTYLCSYMTKVEKHCSEAIRAAAKEARKESLDLKQSLKKIDAGREVNPQEYVYGCLPEL